MQPVKSFSRGYTVRRCKCKRTVASAATRRGLAIAVGTAASAGALQPLVAQASTSVTQDPKFIEETNRLSSSIRTYMALVWCSTLLVVSQWAIEHFSCEVVKGCASNALVAMHSSRTTHMFVLRVHSRHPDICTCM